MELEKYMKLNTLLETPLPDNWDKNVYKQNVSFAQRIKYAKQQAAQIGAGSSRVAFIIDYQGRPTVLKVAKNKKGIAQNEVEIQALSDWYLAGMGIMIPMIDYDEENNEATWLHVEKADKITPSQFKKFFGGTPQQLVGYAENKLKTTGRRRGNGFWDVGTITEDNEYVQAFMDYVMNYEPMLGDYNRLANWGVFDGHPVIIDVGLDKDTFYTYYQRK
jgi:hypothetical protein